MEPTQSATEKPKFNWKWLLITAGIVFVTAGIIGGSVYSVMSQQATKDKNIADKRAQDLQKQIDILKKTITSTSTITTSTNQTITTVAPGVVVSDFLTSYLSYIYPATTGHTAKAFASSSTVVTDTFVTSVNNSTYMSDPIILAQNLPFNEFTLGNITTNDNGATVPVTLNYSGGPFKIVYTLVNVNNKWMINSVSRG